MKKRENIVYVLKEDISFQLFLIICIELIDFNSQLHDECEEKKFQISATAFGPENYFSFFM